MFLSINKYHTNWVGLPTKSHKCIHCLWYRRNFMSCCNYSILQHSNLKPWCFHMISTLQMHCVLSPFLKKTNGDHFSSYRDTSIWEPLKSLDLLSIGLANRSQHLAGIWAGCNVIIGSIAWFFWSIFDTPKLEHMLVICWLWLTHIFYVIVIFIVYPMTDPWCWYIC